MSKVYNLYFSPTGGTKRISERVANNASVNMMRTIDTINITDPINRQKEFYFDADDFLVIASPTYAGKLPNKILGFFKDNLKGNGTKVIAIVTYGNRSFDNSLAELVAILEGNGFDVISAGAFVTRHVFSPQKLAPTRPDENDLNEATKLFGLEGIDKCLSDIPGDANAPYYVPKGEDGNPVKFLDAKPVTDETLCNNCKICAMSCPMQSIDHEDVRNVPGICIKCHACIFACAKGAKSFNNDMFLSHKKMLENSFTEPKGNYLFKKG